MSICIGLSRCRLLRYAADTGAPIGGFGSRVVMCAFGAGFQGDTAIEPLPVSIRSLLMAASARYSAFRFSEGSFIDWSVDMIWSGGAQEVCGGKAR